jgi:hypothetical protein
MQSSESKWYTWTMDNITVQLTPEEVAYLQEALKRTRKAVEAATWKLRDMDYDDLSDNQIWEISFGDRLVELAAKFQKS